MTFFRPAGFRHALRLIICSLLNNWLWTPSAEDSAVIAHGTVVHGTAQVIIVAPGSVVAASDSKEVSYSYLSDGTTKALSYDSCKLRRVGPAVVMGAGFVRANDFNALDFIRDLSVTGEELHHAALRILRDLPEPLGRSLEAARKVGDTYLRNALDRSNALELALIGVENGQPGLEVLTFRARVDPGGRLRIEANEARCPGDCPKGFGAYFLGVHEAIDRHLAASPVAPQPATVERATELIGLEYADRADIVGGPKSLIEADARGVRVIQTGACPTEELMERPQTVSEILDAAEHADVLRPFADELERRLAGVSNLLCHQTLRRHSTIGRRLRQDVVEADLLIAGGKEVYSNIHSSGRTFPSFTSLPGAWASGDLLTILQVTRDALAAGKVRLETRTREDGVVEHGVTFQRSEQAASWSMFADAAPHSIAFRGTAWFAASSHRLHSIEWKSTGNVRPARLNIAYLSWKVSFSPVDIGGEAFLAPAAATYAVKYLPETRREDNTHSTFTGFRRFKGEARLLEEGRRTD